MQGPAPLTVVTKNNINFYIILNKLANYHHNFYDFNYNDKTFKIKKSYVMGELIANYERKHYS